MKILPQNNIPDPKGEVNLNINLNLRVLKSNIQNKNTEFRKKKFAAGETLRNKIIQDKKGNLERSSLLETLRKKRRNKSKKSSKKSSKMTSTIKPSLATRLFKKKDSLGLFKAKKKMRKNVSHERMLSKKPRDKKIKSMKIKGSDRGAVTARNVTSRKVSEGQKKKKPSISNPKFAQKSLRLRLTDSKTTLKGSKTAREYRDRATVRDEQFKKSLIGGKKKRLEGLKGSLIQKKPSSLSKAKETISIRKKKLSL